MPTQKNVAGSVWNGEGAPLAEGILNSLDILFEAAAMSWEFRLDSALKLLEFIHPKSEGSHS